MAEKAHKEDGASPEPQAAPSGGGSTGPRVLTGSFTLRAMLDRQHAEFVGGPTMADIMARADERRERGMTVARESIVETLHEVREERGEHLWRLFQK